MRKNVLVVAQQVELRARIARVLQSAGYGAELAENPKRALELARRKDIQAAIVVQSRDLACLGQELRDKIPTTILLGHRTDDIVRPGHSLQETDAFPEDALDERKLLDLLSQAAALPGSKGDETVPAPVKIEDCNLDLAGHTFVDGSGREVRLTRAETALLTAFVDSPRRVLSRDQLRNAVAGRGAEPYDRSVDMLVARLRRKIEPDPKAPRFILSVPGVGYKFDVRPQSAANGEAPPALEPQPLNQSSRGEAIPAGTPSQGSAAPHSPPDKSAVDGAVVRARRLNSARSQPWGSGGLKRHHPTFPCLDTVSDDLREWPLADAPPSGRDRAQARPHDGRATDSQHPRRHRLFGAPGQSSKEGLKVEGASPRLLAPGGGGVG